MSDSNSPTQSAGSSEKGKVLAAMSNRSLYQKNHDVTAFAELPGATIQDKITSAVTSDEHK